MGCAMNVTITSKLEDDYHLIEVSGIIFDFEEYKQLTKRYYDEIMQYGKNKIIIDASRIQFPNSLLIHSDLVHFYSEELPGEVRSWKIAVVTDESTVEIGNFWEFQARQSGYFYKVFSSMEDAQEYMRDVTVRE